MACRFYNGDVDRGEDTPLIAVTWRRGACYDFPNPSSLIGRHDLTQEIPNAKVKSYILSAPRLVPVVEHYRPHCMVIERSVLDKDRTIKVQANQLWSHGAYTGIAAALRVPAVLEVLPLTLAKYFALVRAPAWKVVQSASMDYPDFLQEEIGVKYTHVDTERAWTLLLAKYGMDFMDRAYEKGVRQGHQALDHIPRFWAKR